MPSFLRYLRDIVGDSRTAPDPTFSARIVRFDSLLPLDTWDNDLDRKTLVTLAIWYKAHDNRLRTFDWERYLDPNRFEIYSCTPPTEAAVLLELPRAVEPRNLFGRPTPAVRIPLAPITIQQPADLPPVLLAPPPPAATDHPAPLPATPGSHNVRTQLPQAMPFLLLMLLIFFVALPTIRSTAPLSDHVCGATPLFHPNVSDMDRKTFLTTNLHVLDNTDPILINAWYSQLVLQATSANIDLCPLHEFDSSQALVWPSNNPANHVSEMANIILLKMTPLISSLHCPALHLLYDSEEVTHSDSKLAGYRFLHALVLSLANTTIKKQSLFAIPLFSTSSNDVIQFATG